MHESSSQGVCAVEANQNIPSHNAEIKVFIQIILILENDTERSHMHVFFEEQKQERMFPNSEIMKVKSICILFI